MAFGIYVSPTSDPLADWARYCEEEDEYINSLPVCDHCKEPIMDEDCYEIGGEIFCKDCLDELFMVSVESLIKE